MPTAFGRSAIRATAAGGGNAPGGSNPAATGGTVTTQTINGVSYKVHTFTASGNFVVSTGGLVDILLVGGGGSGGASQSDNAAGGGGGGGEYRVQTGVTVAAQTYSIVVGAGGIRSSGNYAIRGTDGESSTGLTYTAEGGGAGGAQNQSSGILKTNAGDGGNLRSGSNTNGGGGSSATSAASTTGTGRDGTTSTFTSTSTVYGGGGGRGFSTSNAIGQGGAGGGGRGATWEVAGTAGAANTGGGGGGGSNGAIGSTVIGQNGGSGIVIIRYLA